ncbi:zf-HC2 domain-containing protein [Heyndrickxia sp. NPDC080065]|uniref:zf-HC2 domain-containing protein n=1 Tax=Heyndrickxia sp. NPDC080065 TaxID=3390568 RepID=UPI003D054ED9
MKHMSDEEWTLYVNDQLDDKTREQYEAHLFSCDQCLSVYLEVVEAQEQQLPAMTNEEVFTDTIMMKIKQQNIPEKNPSVSKFYQKPIFHYVLAAAMTFILMSTGVFSHLMNVVSEFESNKKQDSSVVEGLMDHTVSFIDKVQKESEKEAKK